MLLTISTTHRPATDLGYLLYKHPDKVQSFDMSLGKIHVFYPEASTDKCTVALLLEIDPIGLVRNNKGPSGEGFALEHYVNDRPYVASSFMSVSIAKVFSTAMNGTCKDRQDLVEVKMPFEVNINVIRSKGGETFLRKLFEPLGYEVTLKQIVLDEQFPEWGESKYFSVALKNTLRLRDVLSHLYVLIPVLDNDKHYWISEHEVQKLYEKGEGWLKDHPEKDQIVNRYLRNLKALTKVAFAKLMEGEPEKDEDTIEINEESAEMKRELSLHEQRLTRALEEIKLAGAERILDLWVWRGKTFKAINERKSI